MATSSARRACGWSWYYRIYGLPRRSGPSARDLRSSNDLHCALHLKRFRTIAAAAIAQIRSLYRSLLWSNRFPPRLWYCRRMASRRHHGAREDFFPRRHSLSSASFTDGDSGAKRAYYLISSQFWKSTPIYQATFNFVEVGLLGRSLLRVSTTCRGLGDLSPWD